MDRETKLIVNWFPNLLKDNKFKITSPYNIDYNCISWALGNSDIWTWPLDKQIRSMARHTTLVATVFGRRHVRQSVLLYEEM